jgi:RHS repeat-associated protein
VTDAAGTRTYVYDGFGRVSSSSWTAGTLTYTTSYTWTTGDRLATITYPSGRVVTYGRNTTGKISTVSSGGPVISGRTYRPDGQMKTQAWGNSLAETRSYDTQGSLQTNTFGTAPIGMAFAVDPVGNVISSTLDDQVLLYGYDALDRLTGIGAETLSYDGNGNRLTDATGAYGYAQNSNQLTATPQGSVTLDAVGNMIATPDGWTYAYKQSGQLATATLSGQVTSFTYRADGLRATKTSTASTTVYHYDLFDRLIAETTPTGTLILEYVWDDEGRPLLQVQGTTKTFLHSDRLGTPRIGTNSTGAKVWEWQARGFGADVPVGSLAVNLRYPGQYFDVETGLHHNRYRTYSPASGRYLQSDPIGLGGGNNTFGYVAGNPLIGVDPRGLDNPGLGLYSPAYNLEGIADALIGNAELDFTGACARYVRRGLEAGGTGPIKRPSSTFAKNYDKSIISIGFDSLGINPVGYYPQLGDIAIFGDIPGHPAGHIQVYTIRGWVSDTVQPNFLANRAFRNSPVEYFRNKQP